MEKSFQVVGKYEQSHEGECVQTKLVGCPGSYIQAGIYTEMG